MIQLKEKKSRKFNVFFAVLFVLLIVYSIGLLVPLLWALLISFKSTVAYQKAIDKEIWQNMINFSNLTSENFKNAFEVFQVKAITEEKRYNIIQMFGNSIVYVLGCSVCATIVPCVMSYLCARFKYRYLKIIYWIVLLAMAIPIVGSLPSEITMSRNLGMYDSVIGLYIMKANFLGIYFLLFYAQFKGISMEYTEAAWVDGASELQIMLRIIMPMAVSTMITVFLLNFIAFWNDYQTPMIYWPSKPVAAYGIYYINTATNCFSKVIKGNTMPLKFACIIICALPILAVYALFSKKLTTNVSIGGIKG